MRDRRRHAAFLTAGLLLAGACGRGESNDDSTAETAGVATTTTSILDTTVDDGATSTPGAPTTTAPTDPCAGDAPTATDVGITADTITIEVLADVGSPVAPGLFQANIDAINAFADRVNQAGGIACRQLIVRTWDTKLSPDESKNGQIDACANAFALVGGNSLFNPDVSPMATCPDLSGAATGLPNVAALANDVNEMCSPTTYNIQVVPEQCPVTEGQPRPIQAIVGPVVKWFLPNHPDLHGTFAVPGDLPSTVLSAMPLVAAQAQIGVTWDQLARVSGRDEQVTFVSKVASLGQADSNYYYNGAGDRALVSVRKEAAAQGVEADVWACALGCYTRNLLETGGADVEGTYVWMQFLPFEERDTNAELAAYLDGVGTDEATSFGAQAWQAGVLFQTAVEQIVATDGINALTRSRLLDTLDGIDDFTANGWMGAKDLKGMSNCFVLLQVQQGEFVRVFPEQRGTLDCDPANLLTVNIDPAVEAQAVG